MKNKTVKVFVAIVGLTLMLSGCGSSDAVGTADAGKPKFTPPGAGAPGGAGMPNGAKKGGMQPPGI